jgi:acetyl esterase/lipase
MGQDLRDPAALKQFLYPFEGGSKTRISESSVVFDPVTKAPNNIRMAAPPLYLQLGVVLDHYTGLHEPSLSAKLRKILEQNPNATSKDFEKAIPVSQRYTFPELNVSAAWPPTLTFHGTGDTAVLASESQHLTKLLKEAGVDAETMIAPGQEHMFDMDPTSEERWAKQYDIVKDFFFKHLGKA